MQHDESIIDKFQNWVKNSITVRLVTIGILILIMLIPISFIQDLIYERQNRQDEAIREVSSKWGEAQTLTGPVLSVPYTVYKEIYENDKKKVIQATEYAHFLPENLNITTNVEQEIRYRGMYEVVVYTADITVSGNFANIDPKSLDIKSDFHKDKAFITTGLSDLRGIKENVELTLNNKIYPFSTGLESTDVISSGISTKINLNEQDSINMSFSYKLKLHGSTSINFIPLGKETTVAMKSTSKNPSFTGAFLPEHTITKDGFDANWKVFHLNRSFPQSFRNTVSGIYESSFGVELLVGVDEYQKNTRASKYAILFIMLTFMTFFFVQTINKVRIHPVQYLLVGLALTIFYTLLLSISEHLSFGFAYLIASVAVIGLITLYTVSMFQNTKLTIITGLILTLLYGFIYTIIRLQDYSLLFGSIGLFLVLGTAMYVSRKIDWFSLKTSKDNENTDK